MERFAKNLILRVGKSFRLICAFAMTPQNFPKMIVTSLSLARNAARYFILYSESLCTPCIRPDRFAVWKKWRRMTVRNLTLGAETSMISFAMWRVDVKSYNYQRADKRMWNVLRKSALEQPAIAAILVVVIVVERKKVTARVPLFAISRSGAFGQKKESGRRVFAGRRADWRRRKTIWMDQ